MRFAGKTAIVTGAAGHLGFAIAERFASEGAEVAVWDLTLPRADAAVSKLMNKGYKAIAIGADVSSRPQIDAAFQTLRRHWNTVDILVNNAGLPGPGDGINAEFIDYTDEQYDRTIDINVKSVFMIGQAAARWMVEKGTRGSIINVSSINALMLDPVQAVYGASKGAVLTMTRGMAVSLGSHGIRVNAIGPAGFPKSHNLQEPGEAERQARVLSRAPLGRFGTPDEVAGTVAFFASDDSSYVTGQILYIDGGRMCLSTTLDHKQRMRANSL